MDFLVVFSLSLCAELIANDKPLLVRYEGQWYFPLVKITASAISAARWRQRQTIRTHGYNGSLRIGAGCCGPRTLWRQYH
ncbi:hypothetical protein IVZ55_24720 [Salmonella enterica subsp. enterica serovar Worthington]|nr:hypothetical protein [Salmonella enterica subsp. enterica serovar Worthington]MBP1524390.1 hypothetical protein [Salmonella enterica subsp. enterica serovar Worthington]